MHVAWTSFGYRYFKFGCRNLNLGFTFHILGYDTMLISLARDNAQFHGSTCIKWARDYWITCTWTHGNTRDWPCALCRRWLQGHGQAVLQPIRFKPVFKLQLHFCKELYTVWVTSTIKDGKRRRSRSALALAVVIESPALCHLRMHSQFIVFQRPAAWRGLSNGFSLLQPVLAQCQAIAPETTQAVLSLPLLSALMQPVSGLASEARTERNRLFNTSWQPRSALWSSFGGGSSKQRDRRAGVVSGSSKKKKLSAWNHSFVCLTKTAQTRAPSPSEWTELLIAGLG